MASSLLPGGLDLVTGKKGTFCWSGFKEQDRQEGEGLLSRLLSLDLRPEFRGHGCQRDKLFWGGA